MPFPWAHIKNAMYNVSFNVFTGICKKKKDLLWRNTFYHEPSYSHDETFNECSLKTKHKLFWFWVSGFGYTRNIDKFSGINSTEIQSRKNYICIIAQKGKFCFRRFQSSNVITVQVEEKRKLQSALMTQYLISINTHLFKLFRTWELSLYSKTAGLFCNEKKILTINKSLTTHSKTFLSSYTF